MEGKRLNQYWFQEFKIRRGKTIYKDKNKTALADKFINEEVELPKMRIITKE